MSEHRVSVRVTVVIDGGVDAWNREYGSDEKPREVTRNVKSTTLDAVKMAFAHLPFVKVEGE